MYIVIRCLYVTLSETTPAIITIVSSDDTYLLGLWRSSRCEGERLHGFYAKRSQYVSCLHGLTKLRLGHDGVWTLAADSTRFNRVLPLTFTFHGRPGLKNPTYSQNVERDELVER